MKKVWKAFLALVLLMLLTVGAAGAEPLKGGADMAGAVPMAVYGNYLVTMNEQQYEWFVFRADEDPAYYWANLTNEELNTTLYMTLYDKDGLKITEVDANKGQYDYISWKAAPGETYYLRFSRYHKDRNGRFTLFMDKAADIHGNDVANAQELQLNEQQIMSFDGTNDVDFLKLTAAEGSAYYRADFKNEGINTTMYMTLLDKDGLKIAEADANNGQSDYLSWQVVPGETYYLKFSRYDGYRGGPYTVSMKRYADAEPNEMEKGLELTLDGTVKASFDGSHDVDFMKLTAAEGSAYYRVDYKNENVNTTMYMTLLDKNGLKIAEADANSGQSDYLSWKVTPGETYYLKFSRYDGYRGGTYTVSMKRYADAEPDEMAGTEEMPRQQTIRGAFDGSHDVDFFRFTTKDAPVNYLVNVTNENINTTMYVELLDENGLALMRGDINNGRSGWLNWYAAESKVYYLKFYRYDAYRGGEYTLTLKTYEDIETSQMETGVVLENGKQGQFTLGAKEDVDWFILPAGEAPVYSYLTLSNFDTCGRMYAAVYNAANQELASWRVDNQREHTQLLPQSDETLYVKINGDFAGEYTLLRADSADEGGSSRATARKPAAAEKGQLVFEINNDVDYLAFPGAGAALMLTCDPNTTVYVTVVDENGQIIRKETRIRGNESAVFVADRNQAYLQIKGSVGSAAYACCTPEVHVLSGYWLETVSASCTREGRQEMLCTVCQQVANTQTIPMTAHQAGEWKLVRAAGCDDQGLEARYCLTCSQVQEERNVPATGHIHTYWETVAEATCEGEGLQIRMCGACGKQLEQEIIPATGHVNGDWVKTKWADCETNGQEVRQCKICRKTLAEKILPAFGHMLGEWQVQQYPSCETDGLQVRRCLNCGARVEETLLYATGHQAGEWLLRREAACDAPGLQVRACVNCSRVMEEQTLPALAHVYGEWAEVTAPTRDAVGVEEQTCVHCGHVQSREIPKLSLMESIFGR